MQKCDPSVDVDCVVGVQRQELELEACMPVDDRETCVLE